MDEEIALHLEMRAEQLAREGRSPEEARREAQRRFGSMEDARRELFRAAREREHRVHLREGWTDLRQDLGYALRAMLKAPGFTAAVVLTLALGIGASSTMFSVVDAVLLRPFGFADPERLAVPAEFTPEGDRNPAASGWNFQEWRRQSRSFQSLAAYVDRERILTGAGEAEELNTRVTTGNFFAVLGQRPLLGRTYTEAEETERVAVLSHGLWQRRFGGDPAIVGRTLRMNDLDVRVVGVMGPDVASLGERPDLWAPMRLTPEMRGRFVRVVGRLRPGVSLEEARTEFATIARRLGEADPQLNKGWSTRVLSLREEVSGEVRPALLVLLGAVGFLLLIACANVANLLLSRAAARRKEVAVRRALGATRGRLVRQLLTESLALSAIAGALGVAMAFAGTRLLVAYLPEDLALPRLDEVGVDLRIVAITAGVSLLVGILFGLAPALLGSSVGPGETLRDASRGSTAGRERGRVRAALVVAEVALALMLLAGAGLLARSFGNVMRVDTGLRTGHVLTLRIAARAERYQEPAAMVALSRELRGRLATVPGVRDVGLIGPWLPLTGAKSGMPFQRDDRPPSPPGEEPGADIRIVDGDYHRAVGVPLRRGRAFEARDTESSPDVILVNDALAQRYFRGEDPVGKRITVEWGDTLRAEIVGVVGSVRELSPTQEPSPAIYIPFAKRPDDLFRVVVRTTGDPEALAGSVREIVRSIDPNLPVSEIRTLDDVASGAVARPRLYLLLLGVFAALALLLAAIGLYGVIAYSVAQRRAEIGVRVALGATGPAVQRLVVGEGMRLAALGLAVGLAGALLLTRLMRSLLFGVAPTDPLTLAATAALLAAVALAASWLPARRAAGTDPMIALRAE
jgi:putative ABC transport system permease protein